MAKLAREDEVFIMDESSCEEEERIVKTENFLKVETGKVKVSIFVL